MKWNKQASGSRKAILAAGKMPRRGLEYRNLAASAMLALANVALAQSLPATAPASQPALPPGHPALPAGPLPLAGDATLPAGHPAMNGGTSAMPLTGDKALPAGHPAMDGAAPGMSLAAPPSTLMSSQATAMKGTLNITAVPARANGTSVANEPVTIEFFQDGKPVKRMEAKTDGLGKVTISDVPLMPPTDVVLSAKHAGLFQQVMTPQVTLDAPVTDAQWKMYEPTEEMPAWTVAMQHMIVEWKPAGDGATVTEMVSTNNPSDLAWIGAKVTDANGVEKHVTMTLPLPPDARNVSLSENFDEDNSRMEGGKLVTGSPLYPGRTEFRMTYDVPVKDGALELPIMAPAAVGNLIVFVPADDTQITATGVSGGKAMDMGQGGGKVRMYTAQNLAAGAVASLSISGIKPAPAATADEAPAESGASALTPRNLVMGGAFLLVLVGAALMLMKKPAANRA